MDQSSSELNLERFICEMDAATATALEHERLMDLFTRLRYSDELVLEHTCFASDQYTRNLVCRTPAFELLVLCWRPGHESTIHDHAGSLNAIRVFRGALTSRVFVPTAGSPAGAGPVVLSSEERLAPGRAVGVDRGGVHQLANTAPEDLITVHVYSPPLTELVVYSTDRPGTERRRLRYTLADDLG